MLKYKVNILDELKKAGYSTYRIRKERLIGEATAQKLRIWSSGFPTNRLTGSTPPVSTVMSSRAAVTEVPSPVWSAESGGLFTGQLLPFSACPITPRLLWGSGGTPRRRFSYFLSEQKVTAGSGAA